MNDKCKTYTTPTPDPCSALLFNLPVCNFRLLPFCEDHPKPTQAAFRHALNSADPPHYLREGCMCELRSLRSFLLTFSACPPPLVQSDLGYSWRINKYTTAGREISKVTCGIKSGELGPDFTHRPFLADSLFQLSCICLK